ncbi:alpha/beta hydrolase, partial [Mycobacterium tuberculosis]
MGVGDVDNAERVGVTMGGLNTRVSSSVGDMV